MMHSPKTTQLVTRIVFTTFSSIHRFPKLDNFKMFGVALLTWTLLFCMTDAAPTALESNDDNGREARQLFRQNPDGSITASIAASESLPGTSFDLAQTINIGPNGASFSGGQSLTSDIGGNKINFGQSNSQNSLFGPNGFSMNGANSASNSFSNPFFQSSNAQANAFANQFNQNMPFGRF